MRFSACNLLIAMIFASTVLSPTFAAEESRPEIGDKVRDFQFTDIRYLPRTLGEFGDRKAYVLVFTTLECPIAKRSLPRLRELEEEYRDKGVQFLCVNVGMNDSIVDVAYQAVKADIPFPFVKDFTGDVVAAVGAMRTPECVVLDAKRILRYRGRVDSANRFGGVRPKAGRADLQEAIDDVLAGREVRLASTPVDGCLITDSRESKDRELSYYADVAPLIKKHCRLCHQPGSAAPFSLITADDVLAHAEMIGEVVAQRRMPPWYAASETGHFANDPSLPLKDVHTIVDWVKGNRDLGKTVEESSPPAANPADWKIGEPDLVITTPFTEKIPATGYIPYRYTLLPYVFLKDTWVQKIEINPGNDEAVHHCNMGFFKVTDVRGKEFHPEKNFITGFVPGGDPMLLDSNIGFRIPAGSVLGLQLHYVSTGEETTDRTSVGLVFAKEKIQKQIRHFQCHTGRFQIPPGATHHEVKASKTFSEDSTGIGMFCHMHLRGKDMTFVANYPDGKSETLLSIPNYNFEWQSSYRWEPNAVKFPKGTRIDCTAHYDNSEFNPFNPDPSATVRHGNQTYHEMMYGFVFFTHDHEQLDLTIDPKTGYVVEK